MGTQGLPYGNAYMPYGSYNNPEMYYYRMYGAYQQPTKTQAPLEKTDIIPENPKDQRKDVALQMKAENAGKFSPIFGGEMKKEQEEEPIPDIPDHVIQTRSKKWRERADKTLNNMPDNHLKRKDELLDKIFQFAKEKRATTKPPSPKKQKQ